MPLKEINKYTRAGKYGKLIACPKCNTCEVVFHFSWSALVCPHCSTSNDKKQWRISV